MELINYNDIDFSKLQEIDKRKQGKSSTMYEDGDKLIKIFKPYFISSDDCSCLYKKFQEIEKLNIDGIIIPDKFIAEDVIRFGVEKKDFKGYTMDKFINSANVYDHFGTVRSFNCSDLFKVLKQASLTLKNLHDNGIVFQDISYFNILFDIDDYSDVKFCDLDGCSYKRFHSKVVAYDLYRYYKEIKGATFISQSPNTDKLIMILSLFNLLFRYEIEEISDDEYTNLSSKINTLANLKDYFLALRDDTFDMYGSELPYLHEVIDDNESFVYKNVFD